jgi:pyruvate dehydrogenase E1 component
VDRYYIVIAALTELVNTKKINSSILLKAIKKYQLDGNKPNPMNV